MYPNVGIETKFNCSCRAFLRPNQSYSAVAVDPRQFEESNPDHLRDGLDSTRLKRWTQATKRQRKRTETRWETSWSIPVRRQDGRKAGSWETSPGRRTQHPRPARRQDEAGRQDLVVSSCRNVAFDFWSELLDSWITSACLSLGRCMSRPHSGHHV